MRGRNRRRGRSQRGRLPTYYKYTQPGRPAPPSPSPPTGSAPLNHSGLREPPWTGGSKQVKVRGLVSPPDLPVLESSCLVPLPNPCRAVPTISSLDFSGGFAGVSANTGGREIAGAGRASGSSIEPPPRRCEAGRAPGGAVRGPYRTAPPPLRSKNLWLLLAIPWETRFFRDFFVFFFLLFVLLRFVSRWISGNAGGILAGQSF